MTTQRRKPQFCKRLQLLDLNEAPIPICNYEGSDYQTRFWDQGGRGYEDRVEAIAVRRLLPSSGNLLLELGAGAGRHTLRYQGFERIVLLDYSYTQLLQAQERLGNQKRFIYVAANIYQLPFVAGLFDAATMIRTLHHLVQPSAALHQIRQVLQSHAVFVLEYANKRNLKAIFRYLLRRQSWNPFSPEPIEFAPLNFDFHPRRVRAWLEGNGFYLERQLTVSHFRLPFLKRLVPLRILVGLDSLAQWTGNWWQLTPSVFVRARAVGETVPASGEFFFKCLACNASLPFFETEEFTCPNCGYVWRSPQGIYDFRYPMPS